MKQKNSWLIMSVMLLAPCAFAATPPTPPTPVQSGDIIPIATEAMLDSYAYSLVDDVNIQMSSASAVQRFYTNLPYLGKVADPVALKHLAGSVVPKITSANMEDSVNYYVSYNGNIDKIGEFSLFWGQDEAKPVRRKAGWVLPTFKVKSQRSDWIPWPTKRGLSNAYMIIRDGEGNIVDYYHFGQDGRVDYDAGILYLGDKHTRRLGEVYLEYREESGDYHTDVYNLYNGNRIKPETLVSRGASHEFAGLVTLSDNATNITFEAEEGEANLFYAAYTRTTEVKIQFEAPPGVKVKIFTIDAENLRDDPEGWNPIEPLTYGIDAGRRLFIRFEWGPPNTTPIPNPDDDGGSKGIIVIDGK